MQLDSQDTRALRYLLEIPIDAPRERVWDALTGEIDAWWLPDFHMVGADSVVTLEPRAGGQLLEARADGGSLLWYTVAMCLPGESLQLVGHLAPPWGGPATTMLGITLVEGDGTTLVKVEDALVGRVTESAARAQAEGWTQLFTEGLKAHLES